MRRSVTSGIRAFVIGGGALRLLGLAVLLGLVVLAGACIPKPPTTTAPPSYDDGAFPSAIPGSEVFVGSGLEVPTANAYGRTMARIAAGQVKSADAALAAVPASGGPGDPGDVGDGAALVPGDALGAPLVVFDRCANGDCALVSSLTFDDPQVSAGTGGATVYSGTATLVVAGDGGGVRASSSVPVQGTVVVDAVSGAATLSLAATQPWTDAAGVGGVSLGDVVVSGVLDGLGGAGDVVVDGTGMVVGANVWGLADGVATRVTANVGAGRPVVAVRGFDTVEGGALDRLVGTTSAASESVRRWLRAPEFWVVSAPDGGTSPLGAMAAGTQVRLVYKPGTPALTVVIGDWDFGQDYIWGTLALAPASITGDEFTNNVVVRISARASGGAVWQAEGPVTMNLSTRQRAVPGTLNAAVSYNSPESGCWPCTGVNVELPSVWIGPVRGQDFTSGINAGSGETELEVGADTLVGGRFGPVTVTSGSLWGDAYGVDVDAAGTVAGHAASVTSSIDLASASAGVDAGLTVDEQMQLDGSFDVDLASLSWSEAFDATLQLAGNGYGAAASAQLSQSSFDVSADVADPLDVTDDITLDTWGVHAVGTTVSVEGDAQWRRTTAETTHLAGTLDSNADGVDFDLDSDAVFEWAGGQVAMRDLHLAGALASGARMDIAGTLELPAQSLAFEGSLDADPAGWRFDLHEPAGAAPMSMVLSWDVDAGTLSGSGSLASQSYGRVEIEGSGFELFADDTSVDFTPSGDGGRVRVDGGASLDAEISGTPDWDPATGMLHVDVTGAGSLLGRDGLVLAGGVDAQIVDGTAAWVDVDVTSSGAVAVGDRSEVRMGDLAVTGRLEGSTSTLATTAKVDVLGAASLDVAGDTTLTYTPEWGLDSVGMALPVVTAGRSGSLGLAFVGNLASALVSCSSSIQIDQLGYGDFSLEGVTLSVCYDPPTTIAVSGSVDHVRYRDQMDLAADADVSYDFGAQRLTLALTATGQIGELQVNDATVDMVWDIPAATVTGTSGVDSIDYGRVQVIGAGVNFTGDAGGFSVTTGTATPRVLVDGGATLDAEVSGAVSWDEATGMFHAEVTGSGTVLGRGDLAASGSVDAHVVDGQTEWVDLAVTATGAFPVGDGNEIRIQSFTLTGRLEGLAVTLDFDASVDVPGVLGVDMAGSLAVTFTPGYASVDHLTLDLSADAGAGIEAGIQLDFNGSLATIDLSGWLTIEHLAWGDVTIDGLRVDLAWDGSTVAVQAEVDRLRFQATVDVGGAVNLGWDPDAQFLHVDGAIAGRVGTVELGNVDFEMNLDIPARHLWLNTHGRGRAVFGEGRNTVWFNDFHVWGEIDLDANFHTTVDLNVNGGVGFASSDLGAPIEEWMDGTLHASYDGSVLSLTLSVGLSGTISAANVTLGITADLTRTPMEPTVTLHTEDAAFVMENFEFSGIDVDLLFTYDGAHRPELSLTLSNGRVEVHDQGWDIVVAAGPVTLDVGYEDDTHLRADFAAAVDVDVVAPGMGDRPIHFDLAAAGHIVGDTDTHAVAFDVTADAAVSLAGDSGVRVDGFHVVGTVDGTGVHIDFGADGLAVGPTDVPWVVVASPTGRLTSNPSGQHWILDLDIGTVTAGDMLLTGQVYGSLQLGDITTGGLTFDGSATIGGVVRTGSISVAGMWTDDSLTVSGAVRTAGFDFSGELTWARLAGGSHRLASTARLETSDSSVGLDVDVTYDGGVGLYGTMTAYGISFWSDAVAVGTVTAAFNGTSITATVDLDAGPVNGLQVTAQIAWDVDDAAIADGTYSVSMNGNLSVLGVHTSGSLNGQVTVASGDVVVDVTISARLDLIADTSLHLQDLHLNFGIADGEVAGTFSTALHLTPSIWTTVDGNISQPSAGRYELEVTTSSSNGQIGSLTGSLDVDTDRGRVVGGQLDADGLRFGAATLDNVTLRATPNLLLLDSADVNFSPTAWTPGVGIALRNAGIAFLDGYMTVWGQVDFSVSGPSWLPVGCDASVEAVGTLVQNGKSSVSTAPITAGCKWGDDSGFSGFHAELSSLGAWWQSDSTGTVTDAALAVDVDLDLGDLIQGAAPVRVSVDADLDSATGSWLLDLSAGVTGSWGATGTIALHNDGGIGAYDVTITPSSPVGVGTPLSPASLTATGPIHVYGNGAAYTIELGAADLSVHWARLDYEAHFANPTFTRVANTDAIEIDPGTVTTTGSGGFTVGQLPAAVSNVELSTLRVEADRIGIGLAADLVVAAGPNAEVAFHADIDVEALRHQAVISTDVAAGGDFRWNSDLDSGTVPLQITGDVTANLETGIIGLSDASVTLAPKVSGGGQWAGIYANLEAFAGVGVGDIAATVDTNTGRYTVTGSPGGGFGLLVRAGKTGIVGVDVDTAGYLTGDVTITNDGVAISNGELDWGRSINVAMPGTRTGIVNGDGAEVRNVTLRNPAGAAEAKWCGEVRVLDLLGFEVWLPLGSPFPVGSDCAALGSITGAVAVDSDNDGQADQYPSNSLDQPTGALITAAGPTPLSQYIDQSDGGFHLGGLAAGSYELTITPPAGWNVVGSATRTVTVAGGNQTTTVDTPFLLTPFDKAGSTPQFEGAQDGILDLGAITENPSWRPREQHEFPIAVTDTDGDPVTLTLGRSFFPSSFTAACGNGPQCFELTSNGVVRVDPPVNWDGKLSFELEASDGHWPAVKVLATIDVEPLQCGAVSAPLLVEVSTAEDTAVGGTFTLGDPCNAYFPSTRVLIQPHAGLASSSIKFQGGQPTHDIQWAYKPRPESDVTDVFVIESCTTENLTEWQIEVEGVPLSCAHTVVKVTVTPVDDAPIVGVMSGPDAFGRRLCIPNQTPDAKVRLRSPYNQELSVLLCAVDPEGVYSMDDGTITFDAPTETSERTPADLGIVREDVTGADVDDHMLLRITPPPGWDGQSATFAISVCDPTACGDITGELYGSNANWGALPPYFAIGYNLIQNDWDRYYHWEPQHSSDKVEGCMELYTDFMYTHPLNKVIQAVPPLWHLMKEEPAGSGNWVVKTDELVIEAVNPEVSDATYEVIPGRNGATVTTGGPSAGYAATFSYRQPPRDVPAGTPWGLDGFEYISSDFARSAVIHVRINGVDLYLHSSAGTEYDSCKVAYPYGLPGWWSPTLAWARTGDPYNMAAGQD